MIEKSRKAYQDAFDYAKDKLDAAHPIRLGLALNFSVFHYEIMDSRDEACKMAKSVSDCRRIHIASYTCTIHKLFRNDFCVVF